MLIEIISALLIGILAGTFTGLAPGIHINLIGASVVSLSASSLFFSSINPVFLVVFIVAMSITHTFIDFIPSVFLGCPDTDTELSVLPGHELLKKGQGYEAVMLSAYGGIIAVILLIILAIPLSVFFSNFYFKIKFAIPYILIITSLLLIFIEQKKFSALLGFTLSGMLGILVLNSGFNLKEPLLPLLTGLFGSSSLILSINQKTQIPKQVIKNPKNKNFFKPILGAVIASPLCGFFPGLGSGQAAILGNLVTKTDNKGFITLLGATNTLIMGFSFLSLYAIERTRTGSAVAIQELIGFLDTKTLILILGISLISGIIAFLLTSLISKKFIPIVEKINYAKLSVITLIFLSFVVLLFSNFLGFIVFIVSTFTGIYCISLGVRRTNMMGCLLLPTIVFYLTI